MENMGRGHGRGQEESKAELMELMQAMEMENQLVKESSETLVSERKKEARQCSET